MKATVRLAKQFATPAIAEQHFSKLFSHTSMLTTSVNSPVCTVALPTPITEPSVTTASVISSTDITSLPPTPVLLQSILQSLPGACGEISTVPSAFPSQQLDTIDSVEAHCASALVNLKLDEQFKV